MLPWKLVGEGLPDYSFRASNIVECRILQLLQPTVQHVQRHLHSGSVRRRVRRLLLVLVYPGFGDCFGLVLFFGGHPQSFFDLLRWGLIGNCGTAVKANPWVGRFCRCRRWKGDFFVRFSFASYAEKIAFSKAVHDGLCTEFRRLCVVQNLHGIQNCQSPPTCGQISPLSSSTASVRARQFAARKYTFRVWIRPWLQGCRMEVMFVGRNWGLTILRPGTTTSAKQLSMSSENFRSCRVIFKSKRRSQRSKMLPVTEAFEEKLYGISNFLTLSKRCGAFNLPIRRRSSLPPSTAQVTRQVIWSVAVLKPFAYFCFSR